MYRLKKNVADFTVVDGPFERRSYKTGEVYDEKDIPPQEKHKFEIIAVADTNTVTDTKRKGGK